MLAQPQALINAFLQQVADGPCRWTDVETKHHSKDWPIFDGQALQYIALKREWRAHHQENYAGLQGDAPEGVF
jgi:hypothetical protein